MRILGIILLIAGILMLVFNGIDFKTKEEVADIGPIEIQKEKEHNLNWPMYAGGIVTVAGLAFIVAGRKKSK